MKPHGMAQALEHQRETLDTHALAFEERFGLLVDRERLYRQNVRYRGLLREEKLKASPACVEDISESASLIAERERIARDLHDLLGHTLSVIAIKGELAHTLVGVDGMGAGMDDTRAAAEMHEVAEVARKALAEVRQAIVGLRSIGLLDATRAVDTMLRAAGLETTVNVETLPALTPAQENALGR
jgi:two-component system sensor histidine kinase DesK